MRIGHRLYAGVLFAAWSASALAQNNATPAIDELDQLDSALMDLTRDAEPFESNEAIVEKLRQELIDLRQQLTASQERLDARIVAIEELEDENRKLRQTLRIRYGREEEGLPRVPMPNRDLIESVLNGPTPPREPRENSGTSTSPNVSARKTSTAGPYSVVSEWGRSPTVAASLDGNVSSLIGLAIVVPSGRSQAQLRALGWELRRNYDAYDNINIEVYDEEQAALRYAKEGVGNAEHRMLSISKHNHSRRDSIVLFIDGVPLKIK